MAGPFDPDSLRAFRDRDWAGARLSKERFWAEDHEWPAEAAAIEEDSNEELQAALRCYFEAGRLGDREGTLQFARVSRHSGWDNQEIALKALKALPNPTPAETYQTGLVHHWVAELEEALACHLRAAEAGDGDAQFELSLFYAQGLGTDADEAKAREWLERAAEGGHPRALYNVGAAWASGSRGEPDMDRAAEYYDRAAAAGNGRAAAMIAVMILTEELAGTREQAVERLEQADALGFPTWELLDAAGVDDPREDSDDSDEDDEDSESDDEEDSDSDE